ncbi:glutamate 5-kinase [Peptococcaceae bacterium]|nr:glutamate 5-kinase [Peptococcaceae bacterium]
MADRNFKGIKRIVVKVGSSSLTDEKCNIDKGMVKALVSQIARLKKNGLKVVLVSSGAVACGVGKLKLKKPVYTIHEKQAAAAVGQGILIQMYEHSFAEYGLTVAQVLLTRGDFADRKRFLYARNAIECLLHMDVVPIINENDTVSVEELKFGDNDKLSALVAVLIDAEMLVMLTDIDGLYDKNPSKNADAKLITDVHSITEKIKSAAGSSGSNVGTGGMITKLEAARIAGDSGIITGIVKSTEKDVLLRFINGERIGTVFWPRSDRLKRKKRWIAFASSIAGKLIIDEGAKKALVFNGRSLLPSGITAVEGKFDVGNTVSVVSGGKEIARGIVNFSSEEIEKIKGKRTNEIADILGHKYCDEVIHRNNLVIIGKE